MEMKKYMTPEMDVVEIKIQGGLLAGSINPDDNNDDNGQVGGEGDPSLPLD